MSEKELLIRAMRQFIKSQTNVMDDLKKQNIDGDYQQGIRWMLYLMNDYVEHLAKLYEVEKEK